MKRILLPLVAPVTIAFCSVALLTLLQWWRPLLLVPLDLAARDYLFLREDGPHLGSRPARDDIVLVLVDAKTSREFAGELPTVEDDLQLYQNLLDAGARVVADTHMLAGAGEETMSEIRPLLDGMRELRDDGSLMRDVWISVNASQADQAKWKPNISPIVVNMHPNAFRGFETRFFPLTTFQSSGPVETMPLRIVRAYRGWAPKGTAEVNAELARCGIPVSWAARDDTFEYRTKSPPAFRLGETRVEWFTFPTTSTLVPPAAFWVAYDAPPSQLARYSYSDVLASADRGQFAGKIVIVGRDAGIDPTSDTFSIPTSLNKVSVAEVVGAGVQTVLDERFLHEVPPWLQLLATMLLATALAVVSSLLRPVTSVTLSCLMLFAYYFSATIAFRQGWLPSVLLMPSAAMLAAVLGGTYQLLSVIRARSRVVDLFGRYVPHAVVQQLMQKPELESLVVGGIRRDVTVMFADIRDFTTFSESLDPEQLLAALNSLLDGMVACTFAAEGTLDKFIGDAILVLFNAPLEQRDHPQRAVATALRIQARVADHPSGLSIGIGIHTGEAVVGNVGTPQRMEYTAIGSTVNIASRLCDVAQPGEIVVSAAVAGQVKEQFQCEARPPVRVKGINRDLEIFVVVGQRDVCE